LIRRGREFSLLSFPVLVGQVATDETKPTFAGVIGIGGEATLLNGRKHMPVVCRH
jgi:hypothetical protein